MAPVSNTKLVTRILHMAVDRHALPSLKYRNLLCVASKMGNSLDWQVATRHFIIL